MDGLGGAHLAVEHLGERRVGVAGRRRSSRRGCPAGRRRSPARRARGARRRRLRVLVSVVLPVPPFCERTAIVVAIAPTICRAGSEPYNRRTSPLPVARPLEEGADTREVQLNRYSPHLPWRPAGLAALGRRPRRVRHLRLGAQGRDAEPRARCGWRSRTCRRCSTAPATSTARATAAGCWSTSRAGSGPRRCARAATTRRWSTTRRSRSGTSSSSAPATSRRRCTTPASCSAGPGCGSSPSASARSSSQALGATAREEEPHFWQIGGLLASADDRDRALFALAAELESRARLPRALVLGDDLRLQGDGRAEGARRVLPRPRRRALRDRRLLRPQPLLDQHLALVPARAAVLDPRPQRRDQHDRAAPPGGARARGRDPRRRLGLDGPEPDDRAPDPGRGPQPRRGDGADRAAGGRTRSARCRPSCTRSTCTCARRWARSRRARWR